MICKYFHWPLTICITVIGLASPRILIGNEIPASKQILGLAGVQMGLCLDLACGQSEHPDLLAELAEDSSLTVHGLALSDTALARARKAIVSHKIAGRVVAEKIECRPLPYLNDMANVVVVENWAELNAKGVTMDEVLRVTAPNGVILVSQDGQWLRSMKPMPKDMDEWTHPHHGPDGNPVSTDKVLSFPLGYRWFEGVPMNLHGFSACRSIVLAGGRCFTLGINEVENVGHAVDGSYKFKSWLTALDAFNGVPQWKINCELVEDGTDLGWDNAAPLVADEKFVYTRQKDILIKVDASTGRIAHSIDTRYPTYKLLLLGKTLIAAEWEERERTGIKGEFDFLWAPKTSAGAVEAFDVDTGNLLWSKSEAAYSLISADGVVYYLTQNGNPPTERQVIAIDLNGGGEKWRVSSNILGSDPAMYVNVAGKGFVVVVKSKEKTTYVLSPATGKVMWQCHGATTWSAVIDGLLWRKQDPLTGEVKGILQTPWIGNQVCAGGVFVGGRYLLESRSGSFLEIPPINERNALAREIKYHGVRGACVEGMAPAYGNLYTAQNSCQCLPGMAYGFIAVGPCGGLPEPADFETNRPMEKGSAYPFDPIDSASGDWPTYRHDAERSSATSIELPSNLKELWRVRLDINSGGPLTTAWKSQLLSTVTAPVVANGMMFVAGADTGVLFALDALTGKQLWSVLVGSRVDSPPTCYRGLCLLGAHDGWVYAFRAKDGELVWRVRVAPLERRLVAFSQVESVWPAVGSVLVYNDVAYAIAGRSTESDGGLAVLALDPITGRQIWGGAIGAGVERMSDLLSVRHEAVAFRHINLDPRNGKWLESPVAPQPAHRKGFLKGGLLDGRWTATLDRRAGNAYTVGGKDYNELAWTSALWALPNGLKKAADEGTLWQSQLGQVEGIALTGNAVAYIGRDRARDLTSPGFLKIFAIADGHPLFQTQFDNPPTYDGIAVALNRLYITLQSGEVICYGQQAANKE